MQCHLNLTTQKQTLNALFNFSLNQEKSEDNPTQ